MKMVMMNKILTNKKVVNIVNESSDLYYQVNDNEMLVINYYNDNQKKINIELRQSANSYVVLNVSSIIKNDALVNISSYVTGNDNRTIINVRTICEANEGTFNVIVKANENTKNNEIIEDLKGINENGNIIFNPILEVDTNEIDAQHFATIGSFDKNELFYLQTKGISLKSAYNLLKKSFIYNLFSDEFIDLLNKGKEKDE
ncbi:MAG: hypothetical protein E7164_02575 [Firmicutes bacterium]|nr:hypothetical protein [Bacillota bacterium]